MILLLLISLYLYVFIYVCIHIFFILYLTIIIIIVTLSTPSKCKVQNKSLSKRKSTSTTGCHWYRTHTDLLIGRVEHQVSLGASHGQAEAVQHMNAAKEEAQQAQLFAALQPALQPERETPELRPVDELEHSSKLSC